MEWAPRPPPRRPSPACPVSPVARGMGRTAEGDQTRAAGEYFRKPGIDVRKPITTGRQTSTNRFVAPREERRYPPMKVFLQEGGKPLDPRPRVGRREIPGFEGMGESETTVSGAGGSPIRFIASRASVQFPTSRSPVRLPSPLRSNSSRFPRGLACSSPAG